VTAFPSALSLVATQTRYQLVTFWRIPVAVFFTLGLPLVMLVLFNALFGSGTFTTSEGEISAQQFYTGGLAAFTAVSATFTNLANMVPLRRDEGVLKRWRGTPLPTWIYLAGFLVSAVLIAFVGVVLMLTLGVVVYDLEIEPAKMPAAFVTFAVGVGAFAALGMALASVVKSASSASAIAAFSALTMFSEARFWLKFSRFSASSTPLPRIRSATRRAFCVLPRWKRTSLTNRAMSRGSAFTTRARAWMWGALQEGLGRPASQLRTALSALSPGRPSGRTASAIVSTVAPASSANFLS